MLTARTLTEAQTYVSLLTAADETAPATAPDPIEPGPNVTQGPDAWLLATTAGEIAVPYASEDAARKIGARFGLGVSSLIDAAQWALVAASFARRALTADLAYTGEPDQDRTSVELNWEFAADAVGEALKFLPEGAEDAPESAVWSELGTQARAQSPELVTRGKLVDDLEYYRGTLADFRALYGPAV
ncbi:hypothetical protein [Kribbella sp. CA-293567]|uniref:hypothetical protein n=1 Tax=Kribbella sp. CA-293567 TaxID=3002436 RepID=UPI0022DDE03E|nr:hypothetical protein [Kribbella sp. CA-293567]WBQ01805.1 hypothetical protein OX958_17555 [Kribbella sp. CA-293567]